MELEERVAELERQLTERIDVSVAKNLSLAVENALTASQMSHDSNVILRNLLMDAQEYVEGLESKVRWLIENYPGWDEEGYFTFPDGDAWHQ